MIIYGKIMKNLLENQDSAEAGYRPAQKANPWPDLWFSALFTYPLSMDNILKFSLSICDQISS